MTTAMAPWGKPGAWALDSEENDAELLQQQKDDKERGAFGAVNLQPESDFPSLATAAASKPSKKKKAQTLSLSQFNTGVSASAFSARSAQPTANKGLTPDEMFALPTGPRQRSADELERSRGFRSYGSNGYDNSSNSRWGSSRQPDESRKEGFGRESNRDLAPSRADEVDDWGVGKKSAVGNGVERRDRGGFFEGHSKADDSDNWGSNKSFMPSEGRKFGTSGGGAFDRDRRGGFDSFPREGRNGNGPDSNTWGKKREDGDGSAITTGGRPRLNLQPRTQPLNNGQQLQGPGSVAKPKAANPFGAARPREEVLAEKGQDFKKIDERLDSIKIKEGPAPEGAAFGRGSLGSGNSRVSSPDDRTEKNWRRADSTDSRPSSGGTIESNGGAITEK